MLWHLPPLTRLVSGWAVCASGCVETVAELGCCGGASGRANQLPAHGGDELPPTHRLNRSIRPGVAAPATVLIAEMGGGSLLLQGWRNGPSAYVSADDAVPLRRALAAAYGNECGDEVHS